MEPSASTFGPGRTESAGQPRGAGADEPGQSRQQRSDGWRIHRFDVIDSTNRWLASEAAAGAPDGTVAIAAQQTAGRGRLGRSWEAPAGSALLISVLVRPPASLPPEHWHLLTLAMALAVDTAVAAEPGSAGTAAGAGSGSAGTVAGAGSGSAGTVAGAEWGSAPRSGGLRPGPGPPARPVPGGRRAEVALKWPNDVIAPARGDRKLCGILAETVRTRGAPGSQASEPAIIVGAGVNVCRPADVPAHLADRAIWLDDLGIITTPDALAPEVLAAFAGGRELLERAGPDALLHRYRARCATIGRAVRVELIDRVVSGRAVRVDETGALVVEADGRVERFTSGDVVHATIR